MRRKAIIPVGVLVLLAAVAIIVLKSSRSTKNPKVVAIATLMTHPALDAIQENLKRQLARAGYIEGKDIEYVVRNANGDVQLAASIASELASQNPDVIVAIATPMAQAVARTAKCPIVFAAVTDPVTAGLISALNKPELNITGTSDAWPYEEQLKLIREMTPSVKRLGVLYNPGEAASQYGITQIRQYAPAFGFELVEAAVGSTNEVYPAAQSLAGRSDALFLSSDNTVIAGVAAALKVAVERRMPLYVGDSGTVEKGGLAAVSVGYPELGTETGALVARVLKGEKNLPVFVGHASEVSINVKAAELMNVSIPPELIRKAKVYSSIAQ
jgi:putative ABC transport system substrate-binding protein